MKVYGVSTVRKVLQPGFDKDMSEVLRLISAGERSDVGGGGYSNT